MCRGDGEKQRPTDERGVEMGNGDGGKESPTNEHKEASKMDSEALLFRRSASCFRSRMDREDGENKGPTDERGAHKEASRIDRDDGERKT